MVEFNYSRFKTLENKIMKNLLFIFSVLLILSSCKQDDYFIDGGKAVAKFDGDMLGYLESKPVQFDTIAQVIKLAGLEDQFKNDKFTFFAPNDMMVRDIIGTHVNSLGQVSYSNLNAYLISVNKEPILELSDIDSLIWRKYITRYMFSDAYTLKDYPQIDFDQRNIFPGQLFYSKDNSLFNIGVVYDSVNGVKYLGYRHLVISFVPDASRPDDNWQTVNISSSDIQPNNGVVHTLRNDKIFGFDYNEFVNDVALTRNNTN